MVLSSACNHRDDDRTEIGEQIPHPNVSRLIGTHHLHRGVQDNTGEHPCSIPGSHRPLFHIDYHVWLDEGQDSQIWDIKTQVVSGFHRHTG